MRHMRYFIILASGENRIRVDFKIDRGKVVALYVVQYEMDREGAWLPVARYDTALASSIWERYTF